MNDQVFDHERAQADLGVLVLGALDPAEREAVEAHVAECPSCAAMVAELAPLPGLLKRVDTSTLDLGAPPPEVLDRALAQIRAEQPASDAGPTNVVQLHPRRRRITIAIAAGLTAAAAVIGIVVVSNSGTKSNPGQNVADGSKVVKATDSVTGVTGRVVMKPVNTGTSLTVTVLGVEQGDRCSLVAISKDGKRDVTSTWQVVYRGGAHVNTGTSMHIDQIAKFEVTTPSGDILVSMPVSS